jgi:hypothetical protein
MVVSIDVDGGRGIVVLASGLGVPGLPPRLAVRWKARSNSVNEM